MSDEAKGRAGFNARHLRHGATGTESDRRSILKEAMRDLNDWDADFYANKNPNIVREETHLNKSLVNDGQGGFRHAKDVDEVVEYGNARIGTCDNDKGEDRVTDTGRKWRSDSFETSLFVVSLPRTLCTEIKDFYPVIDERGEPVVADGEPVMRSRWVARDIDEAREYFMRAAGFLGSNVLTGGTDAIHGIAPNFDEAYPHVQIMADTLGPGDDGALRCDASRMWGSHRDVRDASGRQESGKAKLSRYQRELREHMAQWYDVELETAHRSKSSHSREEWARIKDREQIAKALRQSATRKRELIDAEGKRVQDREEEIDERAGKVRVRQAKLAKREAEVTARERAATLEAQRVAEERARVAEREADVEARIKAYRREIAVQDRHIREIAADVRLPTAANPEVGLATQAVLVVREIARRADQARKVERRAKRHEEEARQSAESAKQLENDAQVRVNELAETPPFWQQFADNHQSNGVTMTEKFHKFVEHEKKKREPLKSVSSLKSPSARQKSLQWPKPPQ